MNPNVDRGHAGVRVANMSRMKIGTIAAHANRKQAIAVNADRIPCGWNVSKKYDIMESWISLVIHSLQIVIHHTKIIMLPHT